MTVAAVDRCLSLIEVLAGEAAPLELSELALRVGLPNSAAHRILSTLMARGWVVQDEASQNYALSLRLGLLAFRHLDASTTPDIVQNVLDQLARRTGEYCRLALLEGENLVWVARAQGATGGLRYDPDMGQEIVLHATANGKAWLATLPENEALRIVCARGFGAPHGLGPRAMGSVDELRCHLARTRRQGYATAIEEAEAGTAALAVPFFCDIGETAPVAGTISVAGPLLRIRPERYDELGAALHDAAGEIARHWPLMTRLRRGETFRKRAPAEAPPS
ncbi:MAG: IclR family transcriptional regulator [Alphaproteobacteria bacterium]